MDEMKKREKKWRFSQGVGFLFPGLLALAIIALIVYSRTPLADIPVSSEKVIHIMENLGLPLTDTTEENREKWLLSGSLSRSRSVVTDGLRIDLFEAANEAGCSALENKLFAALDKRFPLPDQLTIYGHRKYKLYGAGTDGHYALYVSWSDRILYLEWSTPNTPTVVELLDGLNIYTRQVKGWD